LPRVSLTSVLLYFSGPSEFLFTIINTFCMLIASYLFFILELAHYFELCSNYRL
jgi:hypothetical protein